MEWEDHSIDFPPLSERGVVLAWLNQEDAVQHGCSADAERGIREEDSGLEGTAKAFRCSLEEAMKFVVSIDPERRESKREWHGYYNEWLGKERPIVEQCRCSFCQSCRHRDATETRGTA
jgi:hypothetical protein